MMHGEQRERQHPEALADSPEVAVASAESAAASIERKEEEFEFAFVSDVSDVAVADEIFLDGQIRPVYPLFDRDLFRLYQGDRGGGDGGIATELKGEEEDKEKGVVRVPLKSLMLEDERAGEGSQSTSSSEADELDGIPEGSYCLWTPGSTPPASPGMQRKSKSTGNSSLRWKLRDLVIGRSHSDGKQKFVFLAPGLPHPPESGAEAEKKKKEMSVAKAHRMYYLKGDAAGAWGERRRPSYLPYRTDLVGLFAPLGGSGAGFHR